MKKIFFLLVILVTLCGEFWVNIVTAHNVELDPNSYIMMPYWISGDSGTITISSSVTSSYDLYYQYVDVSDSLFNQISDKISESQTYDDEKRTELNQERANVESLRTTYQNVVNDSNSTAEQKETAKTNYETALNTYNEHVDTFNTKIQQYNQEIYSLTPSYIDGNWTKTSDGKFKIDTSNYTGEVHFVLWAKLLVNGETYYDETIYSTEGTKEQNIENNTDNNTNTENQQNETETEYQNDSSSLKLEFNTKFKSYTVFDVYVSNLSMNNNNYYYMYISKNKNENPTIFDSSWSSIVSDGKGDYYAHFSGDNARNILEVTGKNYIYIIEKSKDGNTTNVVVKANEMEYPSLPTLGQRLDIWLYDSKKTEISNTINFNPDRKIIYKIGKITSNDILKSFKNDSSNAAFNNLLKYAKNAKYLKTGTITTSGENYNLVKDLKLDNQGYYFVYMSVDNENGKYNELEDVAIYQASTISGENILTHFAFSSINIDERNSSNTTNKDYTTAKSSKLPYTGENTIIGISIITVLGILGWLYHKNKFYKGI